MHNIKNKVHGTWMKLATKFMGDMKESLFLTEGKLTPEEFVYVGDVLVEICPTWSWESGDSSKPNKNLPEDKQYLSTKNVPSMMRAKDLMVDEAMNEENDDEDGWVVASSN